jgi:hypothetical protein
MSERDRLIGVVQSLTRVLDATQSKPMLHGLVSMALIEASEDLVREWPICSTRSVCRQVDAALPLRPARAVACRTCGSSAPETCDRARDGSEVHVLCSFPALRLSAKSPAK